MNRRPALHEPTRLLRWIFRRDDQLVTCQLDRENDGVGFTLALVPHWEVRRSVVTSFDAGIAAFQHHAAVAAELRQRGWTLTSYDRVIRNTPELSSI